MRGALNAAIRQYVTDKLGATGWEEVRRRSAVSVPGFAADADYPDEMTFDLLNAVAEVSGQMPAAVQLECGRALVSTLRQSFPEIWPADGSDPLCAVIAAVESHQRTADPQASIVWQRLAGDRLLVTYQSPQNLCGLLRGLLVGAGAVGGCDLAVHQRSCTNDGASHCVFDVRRA